MSKKLLIKNIGLLQTPIGNHAHKGIEQGKNQKLFHASILIEDGIIKEITEDGVLPKEAADAEKIVDADFRLVTPGLVDGHTHLVFGGYRQHEIPMKLKGATYLEILKNGGGILDTVQQTRTADFQDLYKKSSRFLDEMLWLGTTTCEAKSGYGLDLETELKMLWVIQKLNENHRMDLVPTFMGAHAVPTEYKERTEDFVEFLCKEIIPEIKKQGLAEYCDVFCENSVFNVSQSKKYLECAKSYGFGLKIHADEIEEIGGSKLAGELLATSAEHLIAIGENGMEALNNHKTIAMLLPATSFYLGKNFAPARRMIEKGIPVGIATDFNPGSCPSLNLQFCMNLGYLKYKMSPEEILTAVTINPACAIARGDKIGTLEVGKQADLVIWDAMDLEMLCYRFGSNLVKQVVKCGVVVEAL